MSMPRKRSQLPLPRNLQLRRLRRSPVHPNRALSLELLLLSRAHRSQVQGPPRRNQAHLSRVHRSQLQPGRAAPRLPTLRLRQLLPQVLQPPAPRRLLGPRRNRVPRRPFRARVLRNRPHRHRVHLQRAVAAQGHAQECPGRAARGQGTTPTLRRRACPGRGARVRGQGADSQARTGRQDAPPRQGAKVIVQTRA